MTLTRTLFPAHANPDQTGEICMHLMPTKISIADLEQIFLGDLHSFASKHTDALAGLLTAQLPDDDLSREALSLEMEMEDLEKQVAAAQQLETHSRVTSSLLNAAVAQHIESNQSNPADDPEHVPGEPVYIRLPLQGKQCPDSGLTRSKLNELILATPRNNYTPMVKSINSCPPGKDRGVRLIIRASLKAYFKRLEWTSFTTNGCGQFC